MRKWLWASCALFLLRPDAAEAQSHRQCTARVPQAGVLRLHSAGRVSIYRDRARTAAASGPPLAAADGAPVCIDDLILPGPLAGLVDMAVGADLDIRPHTELRIPGRRATLFELLRSAFRLTMFNPALAGSLASGDRVEFALAGLRDGSARIGPGNRTLIVPVSRVETPLQVELWPPGAAEPLRTVAAPLSGEAVFHGLGQRQGVWRLVIRQNVPVTGRFELVGAVGDAGADQLATELSLDPRERALVFACLNPTANGLEAYNRLARAGVPIDSRRLVLLWQHPTSDLGCGTPF